MDVKRIAVVTGGLAVACGVVGAVVGMVAVVAWRLVDGAVPRPEDFATGAACGAGVGAALGPIAAWLLMRHVPLGLAIGGTALGTLVGAFAGLVLSHGALVPALVHAVIGFAVAAVVLRVLASRRAAVPRGPSA